MTSSGRPFQRGCGSHQCRILPRRLHGQQMLTANGVVIDTGVKIGEFDGDINRCDRVGAHQMDFGMVDLVRQLEGFFNQFSFNASW